MRSLPSILFALLISAVGVSWLLFEEEIREFIGWPVVEEIEEDDSDSRKERVKRDSSTPEAEEIRDQKPTEEQIIQRIVLQRYPDIPTIAFSERFPEVTEIPEEAFPDRVKTNKPVSFSERRGNAVLAASRVKEGGFVRPEKILPGGKLLVRSLGYQEMTAEIPVDDTDFLEVIEEKYQRSQQEAQERIISMRDDDASEIRENSRLLRFLRDAETVWNEEQSPDVTELIDALFEVLDPNTYSVVAFYESGRMRTESSEYRGIFEVTHFLVEGTDEGFGPYLWRVRSLEHGGRVVEWSGLPE